MSSLVHRLRRLLARLAAVRTAAADPDTMPLRDWADLPPYHPLCDRAPC